MGNRTNLGCSLACALAIPCALAGACASDDGSGAGSPAGEDAAAGDTSTGGHETSEGCSGDGDCAQLDEEPCRKVACVPEKGQCVTVDREDGASCHSGDECHAGETCKAGVCAGGEPLPCDDGNACTEDSCLPYPGCRNEPVPGCTCTPACDGKAGSLECGPDGCGGQCGECAEDEKCVEGRCEPAACVSECLSAECGSDGCGGSCGECQPGHVCEAGMCSACTPDCSGRDCGPDGCSGSCGECAGDELCNPIGKCVAKPCVPKCAAAGAECGADGCGGNCGTCKAGTACGTGGKCEDIPCVPACEGKECGSDGCGESCGECAASEVCTVTQQCVAKTCTPDCGGKECGDDGCGGLCGSCTGGDQCNAAVCAEGECVSKAIPGSCDDSDACTTNDQCAGGLCKGTLDVDDGYEPNDTWIGAALGEVGDCGGMDGSVTAKLLPAGEEDWYWFQVKDQPLCDTQPIVELVPPKGANYDVCVFFTCIEGKTSVTCKLGTPAPAGPGSPPWAAGCCSKSPGSLPDVVKLDAGCGLFTDSHGWVDIRVFPAEGEESCLEYQLSWGDS